MSFGIYAVGYFIFIIGIANLALLMNIPKAYIVVVCVILLGSGVKTGVKSTRSKDPN